jgi:hypothetical protein
MEQIELRPFIAIAEGVLAAPLRQRLHSFVARFAPGWQPELG